MREKLRSHIDSLFVNAPKTRNVTELKEELLSDLIAKYDDLVAHGESEEQAYKIAIAGIGDVNELLKGLENDKIYNYTVIDAQRKKSAIIVSTAVALYIIAIAVVILCSQFSSSDIIGVVLMFLIAAVATGLLIYNAMSHPRYNRYDDTIVEEIKERANEKSQKRQIRSSINAAIWTIAVAVYLIFSFLFDTWEFSWIIFIIAVAVQQIVKLLFALKE